MSKMGPEIINQEKYHEVYIRMTKEKYILRTEIAKLFNTIDNNTARILDNFDELGLLVYEDDILIPSNSKYGKPYPKIGIFPFNAIKAEYKKEYSAPMYVSYKGRCA